MKILIILLTYVWYNNNGVQNELNSIDYYNIVTIL